MQQKESSDRRKRNKQRKRVGHGLHKENHPIQINVGQYIVAVTTKMAIRRYDLEIVLNS